MNDGGYVNYFEILDLPHDCKPGEVRKQYKRKMKDLLLEISRSQSGLETLGQEKRDHFLLEMAQINAAFYILRDTERREKYWSDRTKVIALEAEWREATDTNAAVQEKLRRTYDAALRHFLSTYLEEFMLLAGRDPECVEASNWDLAHERHAGPILRHFRQQLHQEILERLPFYETTEPQVDWEERDRAVSALLAS